MTQHAESQESKIGQSLSLLEKAVQFRFALLVLSLVLAADVVLIWYFQRSLIAFRWGGDVHVGAVLVFGSGYFFFMATVPAVVLALLQRVWSQFGWHRESTSDSESKHRAGYVLLREAEEHALRGSDSFWFQRVQEEKTKRERERGDRATTARISFACTLLLAVDALLPGSESLVQSAGLAFTQLEAVLPVGLVVILALLVLAVIVLPWWDWLRADPWAGDWIRHPSLAEVRFRELQRDKGGPAYRRGTLVFGPEVEES